MSEENTTHRERKSIEDYSKMLKKLQKISISKDRAIRNQVHKLDAENEFMRNHANNRVYSRKSQCRKQPSQSKMTEYENAANAEKTPSGASNMSILNSSDIVRSSNPSNHKIQLKNLNFLLRPNSVLGTHSPSTFIPKTSLNESEYQRASIPGNIEDKLQHRPLNQSRSNSRLKGIQLRPYRHKNKVVKRKNSMEFQQMYTKDYPSSILTKEEMLKKQLEAHKQGHNSFLKKQKARKRIKIVDQSSVYIDQDNSHCAYAGDLSSWFNTGEDDDLESYGIKVVDDVSLLINGGISDDEQ